MASAIQSVPGAKLVVAPKKGSGAQSETISVVELTGKTGLGAVVSAVEGAKTPHASQCAPGVNAAVPGRLKATATPEAVIQALKTAGLTE